MQQPAVGNEAGGEYACESRGNMKMKKYKSGAPFGFSLPRRLLALFLIFVLTLYAVGMAVAVRLGNNAFAEVRRTYETRVSALADQLDAELQRIQSQIYYTMLRTDVQYMSLVTPSLSFPDIYNNVSAVAELMYALQNSSGLLEKATIYFPLLGKYISSDGRFETFSDEDRQFLAQYNENGGQEIVVATEEGLCLVSDSMRIAGTTQAGNTETAAVIRVALSRRAIADWCDIFSEDGKAYLFGAPWHNAACFLSAGSAGYDQQVVSADIVQLTEKMEATEDVYSDVAQVDGQETLRVLCRVGNRSLWVAGYIRAGALQSASRPFSVWQLVLTAFLLLEVGVFFYIVRKLIAHPINRFAGEVQNLEKEGVLQLAEKPNNDMDFLYQAFLGVSGKLKAALEQAYNNKLLVYQSEIKFLQAQVNPHFLYNSFYHLYRMAKMEDNEGVAEMSRRLSSYYRYITRSDQNEVPLTMEYQNISDYTEIQTIRFGDRIKVELEPIPPGYETLMVPRFVLQPLFENAYNHGVEKIAAGRIQLRFEPRPGALVILVENNGACSDEELRALTAYLESTEPGEKITALKNVKGRMKLLDGDLSVSHGSLGGFCAELTLSVPEDLTANIEKDEREKEEK